MKRIQFDRSKLLLLMGLCLLWAGAAQAQGTVAATAVWEMPAGDHDVDHFIVQCSHDGGPWITVGTSQVMELTFEVEVGAVHRFRVASVNSDGAQSAYTEPSAELIPEGESLDPPGAPGQPIIF